MAARDISAKKEAFKFQLTAFNVSYIIDLMIVQLDLDTVGLRSKKYYDVQLFCVMNIGVARVIISLRKNITPVWFTLQGFNVHSIITDRFVMKLNQ